MNMSVASLGSSIGHKVVSVFVKHPCLSNIASTKGLSSSRFCVAFATPVGNYNTARLSLGPACVEGQDGQARLLSG